MTTEELINQAYKLTSYNDVRIFSIEEQYRHGIITEDDVRSRIASIVKINPF